MQLLVLYYSKGGNTRKLAEAVAEGVNSVDGADAVMKSTGEVAQDDFLAADAVIAGSPVYFGVMAADLKRVFDEFIGTRKRMEGKIGAAFATSGDPTGGKETTMMSILQCLMIYGMIIVGDPMEATGHYGTACSGAPDADALDNAKKLGRRVAEVTRKLRG